MWKWRLINDAQVRLRPRLPDDFVAIACPRD